MPTSFGMLTPSEILAGGTSGGLWGWAMLSGFALSTSVVVLAFIYVWSTLFKNSALTAYVRAELYEVIITAIMIPMIFASVGAMSQLRLGSFVPTELIPVGSDASTPIYDAALNYFVQVENDMSGWLQMNYVMNIYIDQLASVTPYSRPLGVGLVASPLAGLASPIKQLMYNMSVALSLAFIINHAQMVVYIFSIEAFMKYYLPAGVFFRAFTPTRRLGGTLIGVALAFLFVFPALSSITYTMFYNKCDPGSGCGPLVTFRSMLSQYMGTGAGSFLDHLKNFYEQNFTGGFIDLVGGVFSGIGTIFQNVIGSLFLMILLIPVSVVSWAFAIGFVVPAFNIIVFTQAAKGLSKAFGDEVDISSLTRMI
jgi:hypothetical protein